jgi:aspartate carbamoyltransferase catalytic subunit
LKIPDDLRLFLEENNIKYSESDSLTDGLKNADVIYITRIQDEYDINNESKNIDYSKFYIKKEHLRLLKKDCVILHPLPRRGELDPAIDEDSRALYWKQERNGLWIRTALIAYIFRIDNDIFNYSL